MSHRLISVLIPDKGILFQATCAPSLFEHGQPRAPSQSVIRWPASDCRRGLGFAGTTPITSMDIKSDHPEHGSFPANSISPHGPAEAGWRRLSDALRRAGDRAARYRHGHGSRAVAASLDNRFVANSREDYDAAHAALREHPEVKWTM